MQHATYASLAADLGLANATIGAPLGHTDRVRQQFERRQQRRLS